MWNRYQPRRNGSHISQLANEDRLLDDITDNANIQQGHAVERHAMTTLSDLIDRTQLGNTVNSASGFANKDTLRYFLQEAITTYATHIEEWQNEPNHDPKKVFDYAVDTDDDPTANLYDPLKTKRIPPKGLHLRNPVIKFDRSKGRMNACMTNGCRLILKDDYRKECGFSVVTIYPVEKPMIRPDLHLKVEVKPIAIPQSALEDSQCYHENSDAYRLFLQHAINPAARTPAYYNVHTDDMVMHTPQPNGNELRIFIDDQHDATCKEYAPNGRRDDKRPKYRLNNYSDMYRFTKAHPNEASELHRMLPSLPRCEMINLDDEPSQENTLQL